MTVKLKLVHGRVDIFETQSYMVSPKKEMHPDILEVWVYAEGKKLKHIKRHFQKFYKKFLYKPVQEELKPEGKEEPAAEEKVDNKTPDVK